MREGVPAGPEGEDRIILANADHQDAPQQGRCYSSTMALISCHFPPPPYAKPGPTSLFRCPYHSYQPQPTLGVAAKISFGQSQHLTDFASGLGALAPQVKRLRLRRNYRSRRAISSFVR